MTAAGRVPTHAGVGVMGVGVMTAAGRVPTHAAVLWLAPARVGEGRRGGLRPAQSSPDGRGCHA